MRDELYSGAAYADQFAEIEAGLPGRGLAWLEAHRQRALARFAEAGFPSPKVEAFKYTNLSPLTKTIYRPAAPTTNGIARGDLAGLVLSGTPSHLLVFVDGRFRTDLSETGTLASGVRVTSLAEALKANPEVLEGHFAVAGEGGSPLVDLNTAFMADGAVIRLEDGATLAAPVHLLFLASGRDAPAAHMVRNLILAGSGSRATVLESYAGHAGQAYWTNAVTEVVAGAGAKVRHYKLQREGDAAVHLAATTARLAADSVYASFVLATGGRLVRNEIAVALDGEASDCHLGGVYLGRGRQHLDTTTWIDHAKPDSISRQDYKGVLDEAAHGVFQGKVKVWPDAQHTNAHQSNKNLLLSAQAQVDTKPELEIHADDVKCSHGATVGELDDDAIFYLRSRGLDETAARRLLIEAFVGEVLDEIEVEAVREHLRRIAVAWLPETPIQEGVR
jgi:Fe-S cluster assembly protein SufD